jgi:hypothetical protein
MNTPIQEKHYDSTVWTNRFMDELRRHECLCLHCAKQPFCYVAKQLYGICKEENVAMCITRCEQWIPKRTKYETNY